MKTLILAVMIFNFVNKAVAATPSEYCLFLTNKGCGFADQVECNLKTNQPIFFDPNALDTCINLSEGSAKDCNADIRCMNSISDKIFWESEIDQCEHTPNQADFIKCLAKLNVEIGSKKIAAWSFIEQLANFSPPQGCVLDNPGSDPSTYDPKTSSMPLRLTDRAGHSETVIIPPNAKFVMRINEETLDGVVEGWIGGKLVVTAIPAHSNHYTAVQVGNVVCRNTRLTSR